MLPYVDSGCDRSREQAHSALHRERSTRNLTRLYQLEYLLHFFHSDSGMRSAITRLAAVAFGCFLLASCGGSSSSTPPPPKATTPFAIITGQVGSSIVSSSTVVSLPTAIADTPYAIGLLTNVSDTTVGAKGPASFQLGSGASLPAGLTLDSSGVIHGTPSQPGSYSFTVNAVDSSATPLTATGTIELKVRVPGAELKEVAHLPLGAQNADVTVNGHYAYVGTRGTAGSCPASGVRIIDLSRITNPQLVATVANDVSGASAREARIAVGITSASFHSGSTGDLMAVPLEPCDSANAASAEEGVVFYDVTNPASPVKLGTWPSGAPGVRDVAIVPVSGKIYALVALPGPEIDPKAPGDLRVLDITDPANPQQIGTWDILSAPGLNIDPTQVKVGQDQRIFLDSIQLSPDGKTAYLSYWDEGVVAMDVSDPTKIATSNSSIIISHIIYPTLNVATDTTPSSPEGNTHQALPVLNGSALMVSDQVCASAKTTSSSGTKTSTNPAVAVVCGAADDVDLSSSQGWGFLRLYDLATPAQPTMGGFVVTPQSQSLPAPDNGIYTAHNLAWNGDKQHPHGYVAWYSNGIVDVDLTSLSAPVMLGAFVPPATPDPAGSNPSVNNPNRPLIYGVASYQAGGSQYILGSDLNSGLWIVQETPAPTFAILTNSLPDGTVSIPYDVQLTATNGALGSSSITWANLSNNLPSGLSLSPQGEISGTPTAKGTSSVTVQASDGAGGLATETLTLNINNNFAILPVTPVEATNNEAYSLQLLAVNGTGTVSWKISAGTLPPGITLDSSKGTLSGTPTQNGTFSFTVQATDSASTPNTAMLPLSLQVGPLTISTTTLPNGGVGQAYSQGIAMANGTSPFTPTLASGTLPPGVTLGSGTGTSGGTLTGTPTTAGTYTFTIQVKDTDGQTANQQYTVTIGAFAITTTTLPDASLNVGYAQALTVANGTAPFTFSVTKGSLPTGLQVTASTDGSNGIVSGTPTAAGTYTFTIQVKDKNNLTATQDYSLVVQ